MAATYNPVPLLTTFQPGAYLPPEDRLIAAGFYLGASGAWIWRAETGGGPAGSNSPSWLYVWLHAKTGRIFIHHVNKPRAAQNPFLTTLGSGEEFTDLISRYGWHK